MVVRSIGVAVIVAVKVEIAVEIIGTTTMLRLKGSIVYCRVSIVHSVILDHVIGDGAEGICVAVYVGTVVHMVWAIWIAIVDGIQSIDEVAIIGDWNIGRNT